MGLVLSDTDKELALERAEELLAENLDIENLIEDLAAEDADLRALEDLNTLIYDYYDALVTAYENELAAIAGGPFPLDPVTASDIDQAARIDGRLFPETYTGLTPLRVIDLDGGAGTDANTEPLALDVELTAIDALLLVAEVDREGSPEEQALLVALTNELDPVNRQLAALEANDTYGTGSPPHAEALAAVARIEGFLAGPDLTDAGLAAMRALAVTRRDDLVNSRAPTIQSELSPLYDERYVWLDARVNMAYGTRAQLFATGDGADEFAAHKDTNEQLAARYAALGT